MSQTKIVSVLALSILLAGCPLEGDSGAVGIQGPTGEQGLAGTAGINCWDLNQNSINDINEDINLDGQYSVDDCRPAAEVSQSQGVELNHQHICEALANLGQHPEGCPSNIHNTPTGTLTQMRTTTFFDDGSGGKSSCNNAPYNGLLSVKTRGDKAYWVLSGGFVADSEVFSITDVNNGACVTLCQNDTKCIASFAISQSRNAYACNIFYHSDTSGDWERICAVDIPGVFSAADACVEGSAGSDQLWHSLCP